MWLLKHLDHQKRNITVQNANEHVFAIELHRALEGSNLPQKSASNL